MVRAHPTVGTGDDSKPERIKIMEIQRYVWIVVLGTWVLIPASHLIGGHDHVAEVVFNPTPTTNCVVSVSGSLPSGYHRHDDWNTFQ